jgi:5-methyltetrahydropteroyltriglutamate--homocysteine methyltransferase
LKHSTDRILTTHAGSLPRPPEVAEIVGEKAQGKPVNAQDLTSRLRRGVGEVVDQQRESGVDILNDGELSKTNFVNYATERIGGIELRDAPADQPPPHAGISGRDRQEFAGYFETHMGFSGPPGRRRYHCAGPLTYIGQAQIQSDIQAFKAALADRPATEAFLPAVAPGTIEHFLANAYYPSTEAFLTAIADAMHEEYKAIADAGFILQIDDPDLPDAWQMFPDFSVADYRKYAALRLEALNHALRDIPEEQIRLHVCWGSYHGPHKYDVPLQDIVDLVLSVKAQAYSVEAGNPRHAHEWKVWEDTKLPEGKILIPGVVGHSSDFIEHPELVAERLVRFANLVGKENVIAGTDCGLGNRVGHPSIVWAKLQALSEGAELASQELWG